MPEWLKMAITFLSSAAVLGFIQFMITRNDNKSEKLEKLEKIEKQQIKQEKDNVRTQLLLLIGLYPESVQEILLCAEHYFRELKGNWYMSSLFHKWLTKNEISKPEWFNDND